MCEKDLEPTIKIATSQKSPFIISNPTLGTADRISFQIIIDKSLALYILAIIISLIAILQFFYESASAIHKEGFLISFALLFIFTSLSVAVYNVLIYIKEGTAAWECMLGVSNLECKEDTAENQQSMNDLLNDSDTALSEMSTRSDLAILWGVKRPIQCLLLLLFIALIVQPFILTSDIILCDRLFLKNHTIPTAPPFTTQAP